VTVLSDRRIRGCLYYSSPLSSRSGQGLIESCLVMALVCLVFFAVFQISQLFASQEILDYAAQRGARARTVGFNRYMVEKTIRVGAIPNVGPMVNPVYQGGPAREHALEAARIPLYLGEENQGRLRAILDYESWDTIQEGFHESLGDGTLRETVNQNVPLSYAFHRAFYSGDSLPMCGTNTLDEHYTLYLDDWGW